jgi:hypothetical protein
MRCFFYSPAFVGENHDAYEGRSILKKQFLNGGVTSA